MYIYKTCKDEQWTGSILTDSLSVVFGSTKFNKTSKTVFEGKQMILFIAHFFANTPFFACSLYPPTPAAKAGPKSQIKHPTKPYKCLAE